VKIYFIYKGAENLGMESLSALLKSKGHSVRLLFDPAVFSSDVFINSSYLNRILNFDRQIIKAVSDGKPDIVAFSVYTGNYQWCLNIARGIKQVIDQPVVFGGIHATMAPDTILKNECVDYVIRGEGEFALLDLLEHISQKRSLETLAKIDNLSYRINGTVSVNPLRPYIQKLDDLPFPDKDLFYEAEPVLRHSPYLIMTSRGCPYSCSFCHNSFLHDLYKNKGVRIRRRSVNNVIDELVYAKKKYKIKSVCFVDDVFTISQPWLEDFIPKYKSNVNIPFYCNIHTLAFNKRLAVLLKDGGCRLVILGIQSGSERIRKELFARNETNAQIVRVVSYLKETGMPFNVDHIFGAPGETEDDLIKSLSLYNMIKPNMMQTFWLVYFPDTAITFYARKNGFLNAEDIENIEEGRVGFFHNTGSVSRNKVPFYSTYELLFELRTLIRNDWFFHFFAKIAFFLPFKKSFSMCIFTFKGLICFRPWIFNKFRYLFFSQKKLHRITV